MWLYTKNLESILCTVHILHSCRSQSLSSLNQNEIVDKQKRFTLFYEARFIFTIPAIKTMEPKRKIINPEYFSIRGISIGSNGRCLGKCPISNSIPAPIQQIMAIQIRRLTITQSISYCILSPIYEPHFNEKKSISY